MRTQRNYLPQVLGTDEPAIAWLQHLLRCKSVTPSQAGAIDWLAERLKELDFACHVFELEGVTNLIASVHFGEGPHFAFSGHIDVVPAKPDGWRVEPFAGEMIDGVVYGRGAADMKGGVAAMLSATYSLMAHKATLGGTFYWLITSDEEGEAEYGSQAIAAYLERDNIELDMCLVGEPTSERFVGDAIKNGRRGAISGRVKVTGKAGHVAYPEHTVNAAEHAARIVTGLSQLAWSLDVEGSKTSLQVTGINVPNVVDNLVPAECEITFNVRYSHGYRSDDIRHCIMETLEALGFSFSLEWERPCEPYYTGKGNELDLIALVEGAVFEQTGQYPALSTSGGTSDGRFFAKGKTQVIECGVRNHTIHQVNEQVPVADLMQIRRIYSALLEKVFSAD